ncbi:MAG: AIM24 family protein [Candidatus Eremiobacteraeota bacterium]|nr:AIM24 family protein [Candidatus Eremiobacteraeota bacterium]MBV8434759.1 AIM24 family protein [Candidatus Eremiobacteraeota bacterium]MBV8582621.1 AIM24 family protein [Candidatus Eremiobacteraeota bacterium]MBV8720665.1 AIM24 family protein [Candidatus Eremiobacteraeota bacterium]
MKTKITGTTLPVLEIGLEPGDNIIAEPGEFSWMTENVQLKTTPMTAGAKGIFGILGRALSGGGIFMTEYTCPSGNGLIAFASKVPGQIVQVDVQPGHGYMIHRHGFLCATEGVELSIGFQQSLGAGIFGGNGFILQKLAGTSTAWVELGGEIVTYDLQPGESIQVHPGHIGMFQDSVNFDIRMMRGITNALFGGDGLFIAHLTGPGKVWLQTLTLPNLAHALLPYMGKETVVQTTQAGVAGGIAGAVLKDMFGN